SGRAHGECARKFRWSTPRLSPGREQSALSNRKPLPENAETVSRRRRARPRRTAPTFPGARLTVPFTFPIYAYRESTETVACFSLENTDIRTPKNDSPRPIYNLRDMYSAQLLDHFQNPRNAGDVLDADA